MPVTIWAEMRLGSVLPAPATGEKPYIDRTVKTAEPSDTSMWVRLPAWWP